MLQGERRDARDLEPLPRARGHDIIRLMCQSAYMQADTEQTPSRQHSYISDALDRLSNDAHRQDQGDKSGVETARIRLN